MKEVSSEAEHASAPGGSSQGPLEPGCGGEQLAAGANYDTCVGVESQLRWVQDRAQTHTLTLTNTHAHANHITLLREMYLLMKTHVSLDSVAGLRFTGVCSFPLSLLHFVLL